MLTQSVHNSVSGANYLLHGFRLIQQKGLRRFVIMPLLTNLVLFAGAFYYLFSQIGIWLNEFEAWLPSWLTWLTFILWPLAVITILILFSLLFTGIATFIAAPFNGLLAEKVEQKLSNKEVDDSTLMDMLKDTPRIFKREWHKLAYYLPRAAALLLILLVPVVGPVLWFIFGAWMMSLQYVDLAFDNNKISFKQMHQQLWQDKTRNLSFGTATLICSSIPILNLVIMPIAVCGATAMYVEHYQAKNKI